MKSKHFSSLSLYSHTERKDLIRLSGTIADALRSATGAPLCHLVSTNTRPRRRRARVTGRPGRGAAPGAAGGHRHELILENTDPARTSHHTSDRTTPGRETVLNTRMQNELAAARAAILPSARDGETRPALWKLAGSPGKDITHCLRSLWVFLLLFKVQ
ncbi:hypothetical protein cypCar_00032793 [Cyprinus carpio]|nr:hypothetical protein cypCar_00032793 [Cyprinus carpio]